MLPYDQMKAMTEQKMNHLQSQAEQYRITGDRTSKRFDRFTSAVQRLFNEAKDAVASPEFNGPVQPAI